MHAYWLVCLLGCWLICVRVCQKMLIQMYRFFVCKFRPFTLNFYYNNVYNSEKRGNRISHYADVPNKSTRWPSFSWCFLFTWFDFRRPKPTPHRSNRDCWMYVGVCVRRNVRFSVRFARSVLPKIIPTIYQLYEFFSFILVILFCGVHISNLFAIILSFIFWG